MEVSGTRKLKGSEEENAKIEEVAGGVNAGCFDVEGKPEKTSDAQIATLGRDLGD